MKLLAASAVLLFLHASGAHCASPETDSFPDKNPQTFLLPADQPCVAARFAAEKLGILAPELHVLSGERSFAAANGTIKVAVACGFTADETYTNSRLLQLSGINLLSFSGQETTSQVLEKTAGSLEIPFRIETTADKITYVFVKPSSHGRELHLISAKLPVTDINPVSNPVAPAHPIAHLHPEPPPDTAENLHNQLSQTVREFSPPAPSATNPDTSWDLYQLAKENDPALGRSMARFTSSLADSDVVLSNLLPKLSAGAGINQIQQTTNNYAQEQMSSTVTGYNYYISANVPLFQLPSYYTLAAADANIRGERASVASARQNLILRFIEAYVGILKTEQDRNIAQEEIARVKQVQEQAQAFLKAGTGDVIAVYEAQARLDSVIADLNRTESALRIAEQKLSSIVGRPVSTVADILPYRPRSPEPDNLDWWLDIMEKKEPSLQQAKERLSQAAEQRKSAKAEHLPTVQASGGYSASKGAAFLPDIETTQWIIGASVSVPLYTGGATSARIRRAISTESEHKYQLDEVRDQRREYVKQAFYNLRYNYSLINALEQKKTSAEIQLNAVKKGRSIGTRSAIDVLNAEQAYSYALRDRKNAIYDNVLRMFQLNFAAGLLKDEDILAIARTNSDSGQ